MMKKVLLVILGVAVVVVITAGAYLKLGLPDVGDAPEIDIRTADVNRGRYLAMHVAVCMDCHSTRDWTKFAGPLVPGTNGKGGEYFGPEMDFPGKFYSGNITPAGIGNWTDGEIFRAITSGVDKDGKALFPVMPYLHYGKIARRDVLDIVAYLRTLKPVENHIPEDDIYFPMNFIIHTMPQKPSFTEMPKPSDTIAYGGYLVEMAGCIDCHSPVNKGEVIAGKEFSGGRIFKMPNGILRSANITPDKETGIGSLTANAFVNLFKHYEDSAATYPIAKGQVNTIMPWTMFAGMDTSDLRSIYAYLQSLKPISNQVAHFTEKGE